MTHLSALVSVPTAGVNIMQSKKDTEKKVIHGPELRLMSDPVARAVNKYFLCLSSHPPPHAPRPKHSREPRVIFLTVAYISLL